jgi:hypothetical protein
MIEVGLKHLQRLPRIKMNKLRREVNKDQEKMGAAISS